MTPLSCPPYSPLTGKYQDGPCGLCHLPLERPLVRPGEPQSDWRPLRYMEGFGLVHPECAEEAEANGPMFVQRAVDAAQKGRGRSNTMFLGWADFTKDKPQSQKIEEAAERYFEKRGEQATTALVNQADACEVAGLEVRVVDFVRPSHFWVGDGALPVEQIA